MRRQFVSFAVAVLTLWSVAWAGDPGTRPNGRSELQSSSVASEVVAPIRDEAVMVLVGAGLIGLAAAVRRAA